MICRLCRTELGEGDRCQDHAACSKRVQRNARAATASMKTVPLTRDRERQLYNEAMGR